MTKAIPRFAAGIYGESLPMILLSMILLESIGRIKHFCRLLVHTSYVVMPLPDATGAEILHNNARSCIFGVWFPLSPWQPGESCMFGRWFPLSPLRCRA